MTKVFIIQDDGKRDFSQAAKIGELQALIGRDVFPDEAEERGDTVQRIIAARLSSGFDPARDFILLTGDPFAIIAVGVWLGATYPDHAFNVLKYDSENKGYFVITLKP
jgi:hypothetical protein